MKGSHVRGAEIVLGLVLALMGVAGCGEDKADADAATGTATETNAAAKPAAKPAGNLLGVYENAADQITIELKADNKCTLTDEGKSTDLKWEMDGADKVIIHGIDGVDMKLSINSDGHLSMIDMPGVFRKK